MKVYNIICLFLGETTLSQTHTRDSRVKGEIEDCRGAATKFFGNQAQRRNAYFRDSLDGVLCVQQLGLTDIGCLGAGGLFQVIARSWGELGQVSTTLCTSICNSSLGRNRQNFSSREAKQKD